MQEYWRAYRPFRSRERIVMRAMRQAGGRMIQTSGSLFFWFLIPMLSEFEAQFLIGLLLFVSVAAALIYDLFFVPAGMCLWGPGKVAQGER